MRRRGSSLPSPSPSVSPTVPIVVLTWQWRIVAALGIAVVAWVCLTAWPAIVHGNPAYAVLLAITLVVSVVILVLSLRGRPRDRRVGWRKLLSVLGLLGAVLWVGVMAWLKPFPAVEPALAAMESDAAVVVDESPTQITLSPTARVSTLGVFFQPGAKVQARAYAAILRPLAEKGWTVVIAKQPLGIAFLALGAFDQARSGHPAVTRWVVGGHSLGGTVAAIQADGNDAGSGGPVVGLLLYASYPASDLSTSLTAQVLSVSGTHDGLATPADIAASKANLPTTASFVAIQGGIHSYFGDYGRQPGDGIPTITHDDARQQTVVATEELLALLG